MRYQKMKEGSSRLDRGCTSSRPFRQLAGIVAALALCAGLQACSSAAPTLPSWAKVTDDPSWPSLAKITDLDNAMTPEERQKLVQDIQKDDPSQNNAAAKSAGK
jgi:hypothetical protein